MYEEITVHELCHEPKPYYGYSWTIRPGQDGVPVRNGSPLFICSADVYMDSDSTKVSYHCMIGTDVPETGDYIDLSPQTIVLVEDLKYLDIKPVTVSWGFEDGTLGVNVRFGRLSSFDATLKLYQIFSEKPITYTIKQNIHIDNEDLVRPERVMISDTVIPEDVFSHHWTRQLIRLGEQKKQKGEGFFKCLN